MAQGSGNQGLAAQVKGHTMALWKASAKTQQAQEPAPAPQLGPMLAVTAEEIAQAAGAAFTAAFVAALRPT